MDGLREQFGPRLHEARLRLALHGRSPRLRWRCTRQGGLAALSGWIPNASWMRCANAGSAFSWRYWLDLREPSAGEVAEVRHWCAIQSGSSLCAAGEKLRCAAYGEFDRRCRSPLPTCCCSRISECWHGAVILLLAAACIDALGDGLGGHRGGRCVDAVWSLLRQHVWL